MTDKPPITYKDMMDGFNKAFDDDYPPYAKELERLRATRPPPSSFWGDVVITVTCGILAAIAIGGLLIAYGVF